MAREWAYVDGLVYDLLEALETVQYGHALSLDQQRRVATVKQRAEEYLAGMLGEETTPDPNFGPSTLVKVIPEQEV